MRLKKVLTLRTVVATSAGLTLATSSFVAAVQVAGFLAGDAAWLAILIGGLLCLTAGACFAELHSLFPSAAGIRLYFGRAFGDRLALTVSLLYMLIIMGVVGAESYVLASILNAAWPVIPPVVWITVMLVTVTFLNIRGVRVAGNFQDVITYGLMLATVALALIGLGKVDFQLNAPLHTGGAISLINAVAVGVFLFVGFEWVTPLAEEVKDQRTVARGMLIAVGLLSVVYALITVAMTANLPKDSLVSSPYPQLIFARHVLGPYGVAVIVLISLASSITTFNAGLISVSRFFYAAAREHVLPSVFSRISMRFLTPWAAIIMVFVVGLVISYLVLFSGRYLWLVNMAAATEALVYALAGLAVLILRRHLPGTRGFNAGNFLLPATTTLAFAILAAAVLFTYPTVAIGMGVGLIMTSIYVRTVVPWLKQKHRLRQQARKKRRPASLGVSEAVSAVSQVAGKKQQ
ncbi:APC family permease [Desulfurispora thermophila]|uniref:APC family permease n=1 Tax=Desulfurispora thermophila TaxID=265470 RepID=UPI0003633A73|nr:APC family permease [Desulfurispora thermophila]